MRLRNDDSRYGPLAQAFHWLTAGLVLAGVVIALYMTGLPLSPEKIKVYNLHKSIGVTILALTLLRLAWRMLSPPPPLPPAMPRLERNAARASHVLLYALLVAQPVVGLFHSWAASFPVVVFGLVTLPSLTAPNPQLKLLLEGVHSALGWSLIALVCLHVAAALRHHFIVKDEILRRMLPGSGR